MGSSPGFVSHPCDSGRLGPRPIQTRFRCASGCVSLRLATQMNSQTHSPKGTPSGLAAHTGLAPGHSPPLALRLLVGIRFQVLFHSARRRTFHLSLTVLVHYRSSSVFSLGRWAARLPTGLACPVVLRNSAGDGLTFAYRTGTVCGRLFNTFQLAFPATLVWLTPNHAAPTTPVL